MHEVLEYFLWLMIYSFLGWIYETILCSVIARRFINRGFLNGPLCPIYGFASCAILLCLSGVHISDSWYMETAFLFISGMLLACTVEYVTAVLLERLFHAKWWDYSSHRFHFHGRVCLSGALIFGAFSVILLKVIHPYIREITNRMSYTILYIVDLLLLLFLLVDLGITVYHMIDLNRRLKEIQYAISSFITQQKKQAVTIKATLQDTLLDGFEKSKFFNEKIKADITKMRFQDLRLLRAYPRLKSLLYEEAWQKLKNWLLNNK